MVNRVIVAVSAVGTHLRNHAPFYMFGAVSAAAIVGLSFGIINARNYSSLENQINKVQIQPGPQGKQGVRGVPGPAPSENDIVKAVDAYFAAHPIEPAPALAPAPSPAPTKKVELNYSVPKSLYDDATPEAKVGLVAVLKPQAVASGVNDLEAIMAGATKLEFSDEENQVRIYTGSLLPNGVYLSDKLVATVGFSSEADFDKVVATSVLPQFKTVPFISGADYSVALKDAGINNKIGAALVGVSITDRRQDTPDFVSNDPSAVIKFLQESVDKYGLAQVEFGRDGFIRPLYQASADRMPFHTIRTTQSQQAVVMDAMLK